MNITISLDPFEKRTRVSAVVLGILLISDHEPGAYLSAEHDVLYYGTVAEGSFSDEELRVLEAVGWFYVDGSWQIFV